MVLTGRITRYEQEMLRVARPPTGNVCYGNHVRRLLRRVRSQNTSVSEALAALESACVQMGVRLLTEVGREEYIESWKSGELSRILKDFTK